MTLVAQRVADGGVRRLIRAMLAAERFGKSRLFPTERGTPQGGVISPVLSNILLTPFDRETQLHPQKTRVVHVQHGFEFLGFKIKRGKRLRLPADRITSR